MRRLRSRRLGASVGPAGAAPRFPAAGGKPGRAAASAQEPRRRSAPEGLTPLTLATHRAQYVLVNLLAQEHRNVVVVGDDDQSIYRFRGADVRNILDFRKDYTHAEVVRL